MDKRDKLILALIIGPVVTILVTMTALVIVTWETPGPVKVEGTSSDF